MAHATERAAIADALAKGQAFFVAAQSCDLSPAQLAATETLRAQALASLQRCLENVDAAGLSGLPIDKDAELVALDAHETRLNVLAAMGKLLKSGGAS